jgi:Holliday junction resolvase
MDLLASEGWLCASRRHIGGAGDVLAVTDSFTGWPQMLLIEVKSTARSPWVAFGPDDRQALVETAEKHGAEAWLYWWPPRGKLARIRASDFPPDRRITNPQAGLETE